MQHAPDKRGSRGRSGRLLSRASCAAVLAFTVGCTKVTRSECNPFSIDTPEIGLGHIIDAGQTMTGTTYVVTDQIPLGADGDDLTLFVARDDVLERVHIKGSVIEDKPPDQGRYYKILFSDADAVRHAIEIRGNDMTIENRDTGELETLTHVDTTDFEGMEIENLTYEILAEYEATADDGTELIVLRPLYFNGYEDFRLFMGSDSRLLEQQVSTFDRAKDGGSTWISFEEGDTQGVAFFPPPTDTDGSLELNGSEQAITIHGWELPGEACRLKAGTFLCID